MRDFVRFMFSRDGMPENLFAWLFVLIGVVSPAVCALIECFS